MPMVSSGALRMTNGTTTASTGATDSISNFWTAYTGGTVNGNANLNFYRNRNFYYSTGGVYRPNTQPLSMSHFYGSSPVDEWNCACMCK